MSQLLKFSVDIAARLDQALLEAVNKENLKITRSQIKLLIGRSQVSVNSNIVTKAGYPLRSGDLVEFILPTPESSHLEPYDFNLTILYEDKYLLVIDKPSGLSMHPGAGNRTTTLVNALIAKQLVSPKLWADLNRPGIVHRLDRDTTGVIVVAKDVNAHAILSKQFAERSVVRRYLALVALGTRSKSIIAKENKGSLETNIGRHAVNRRAMAVVEKQGKRAVTNWRVQKRFKNGALLELKLETGRTHQIRVHMQHLHAAIVGDPLYAGWHDLPADLKRAAEVFGRQALHAEYLEFNHPHSLERMSFVSKVPPDLEKLITKFRTWKK